MMREFSIDIKLGLNLNNKKAAIDQSHRLQPLVYADISDGSDVTVRRYDKIR